MNPSFDQTALLHEAVGAVRRVCQHRKAFPEEIKTITEVGEPNRIECIFHNEVLATAELSEEGITIKMNYKSLQIE